MTYNSSHESEFSKAECTAVFIAAFLSVSGCHSRRHIHWKCPHPRLYFISGDVALRTYNTSFLKLVFFYHLYWVFLSCGDFMGLAPIKN
jgi:hypothetical protein